MKYKRTKIRSRRYSRPATSALSLLTCIFVILLAIGPSLAADQFVLLPGVRLFQAKLADPLEVQLGARLLGLRGEYSGNMGYSVGLVEVRLTSGAMQLRIDGNTLLVSKLHAPSFPVQSSDYTIAVPLDWRRNNLSARLRWSHVSSHLGDDFNGIDDVNAAIVYRGDGRKYFSIPKKFSREMLELLVSRDFPTFRFYGGTTFSYHITSNRTDSVEMKPWLLQLGIESIWTLRRALSLYVASDFKSKQQFHWHIDSNLQLGVIFGRRDVRRVRLAVELFKGYSNQGQFFLRKERDLNLALTFDFW